MAAAAWNQSMPATAWTLDTFAKAMIDCTAQEYCQRDRFRWTRRLSTPGFLQCYRLFAILVVVFDPFRCKRSRYVSSLNTLSNINSCSNRNSSSNSSGSRYSVGPRVYDPRWSSMQHLYTREINIIKSSVIFTHEYWAEDF